MRQPHGAQTRDDVVQPRWHALHIGKDRSEERRGGGCTPSHLGIDGSADFQEQQIGNEREITAVQMRDAMRRRRRERDQQRPDAGRQRRRVVTLEAAGVRHSAHALDQLDEWGNVGSARRGCLLRRAKHTAVATVVDSRCSGNRKCVADGDERSHISVRWAKCECIRRCSDRGDEAAPRSLQKCKGAAVAYERAEAVFAIAIFIAQVKVAVTGSGPAAVDDEARREVLAATRMIAARAYQHVARRRLLTATECCHGCYDILPTKRH